MKLKAIRTGCESGDKDPEDVCIVRASQGAGLDRSELQNAYEDVASPVVSHDGLRHLEDGFTDLADTQPLRSRYGAAPQPLHSQETVESGWGVNSGEKKSQKIRLDRCNL